MTQTNKKNTNWNILFLCWLVVSVSALGSLFFSYVMEFAPCVLCWYQRVFLFPLVLLLAVGLFPFDKKVVKYALPLAVAGWLTAVYHNLLYAGDIPESIKP
ncbi:MAG: disulfide bond formation protein B, partial [Deltaproteobacteria bacterium]|nr:disulfide bond formation protein B [Deltaproteobacteria bacterium]